MTNDQPTFTLRKVQQSFKVELAGVPGPTGAQGIKGDRGDAANVNDYDPGDLTVFFRNKLI